MLKKLKATLVNGLLWATAWICWGVVLSIVLYVTGPNPPITPFWDLLLAVVRSAAFIGFVGGAAFSSVLATLYRERSIADLSPAKLSLWGAAGGLLLPVGYMVLQAILGYPMFHLVGLTNAFVLYGLPGIVTGYGSIKLAQTAVAEIAGAEEAPTLAPQV